MGFPFPILLPLKRSTSPSLYHSHARALSFSWASLSSGAVPEISCESRQTACACRLPPLQPATQQSTKGTVSCFLENLYIRETMSHDHRRRQEQVSSPGRWQHSCLWDVRVKDVLFGPGTAVAGRALTPPPPSPSSTTVHAQNETLWANR